MKTFTIKDKFEVGASSLSRVTPVEVMIAHLTLGLKVEDIVTLGKDDIFIKVSSLMPTGTKGNENSLGYAILKLLKDGWTAIPF